MLIPILDKIKVRFWANFVAFTRNKSWYFKTYKSYWKFLLSSKIKQSDHVNYFTAIPNNGAGIGHQMANWIAGYWFARQFGLQFTHIPFSSEKWERFLGFGEGEQSVEDLLRKGYKKVNLPLFHEYDSEEIALIKKIIVSYQTSRVIFVAERDQYYRDQFGVIDDLQNKYHLAPARNVEQLIYSKINFNIAIHVRRGDIVIGQENQNPNLLLRWQDSSYFEQVLTAVIKNISPKKPIAIYLFSQGQQSEFASFEKFNNINFCLDMDAQNSFLHMVNADLLITSKSSFSYNPALLCKGVKISPKKFWHGYPNNKDWVLVDDDGQFEVTQLDIKQ